jgi:signal transduction histidine kinase/DNA-binding response OmpR family regulator/ligand-binding sensor domain-containing protein
MVVQVPGGFKKIAVLLFLFIAPGFSLSEPLEIYAGNSGAGDQGMKYIRNFTGKDYNNQHQNWSIIQDGRGIIYVANDGGLMEFDGDSWREIAVPNKSVRSLAADDKGRIYIGGINEIGYLEPDAKGYLEYVSLIHRLDKEYRNFAYVWRSHSTKEGIYFWTSKFLFLWNFKQMKVWKAGSFFDAAFLCNGKLYIRQRGVGILEMGRSSLQLIPGGEQFAEENIYMLVPYDTQRLLIGTRRNGIFICNGKAIMPFPTAADDYLKEKQLYYGIRLSSLPGDFALATRQGGCLIIDSRGKPKHIFDKASGLLDDNVKYIFEDFQGNLWLALAKGISKVELNSPISIYDDGSGLPGIVLSVTRHGPHSDIYAGTTSGLYFLAPSSSFASPGKFRPVPGISGSCWSLLSTGDTLLAAADKGIFQIKNDKIENIANHRSFVLYRSRGDTNRIWVGTHRGLVSMYFQSKNSRWTEEFKCENIDQEIRTIVENNNGNLWLGTRTKGALRVDFSFEGEITRPHVTIYDSSHGLPGGEVHVFTAVGHVMFATLKGIFRFVENRKNFLPDTTFGHEFAGGENGRGVFRIVEDRQKNTWIHSRCRNIQAIPRPDGTFFLNRKPFLRIPCAQVNAIYPDPDGDTVWFGGADGLIRYNTGFQKNYDFAFQTLIRELVVDAVPLFYDAGEFKYKTSKGGYWKDSFPVFPYKDRNLRFEFAAPFFEGESETMYQYFLEGCDKNWSAWTGESQKDYTFLDPGLHTFRVRAKNVYENVSEEAVFQFKVLPPWYRTWWAYLIYFFLFLLGVYFIVKWRSGKLVREKQKLEQIIKERTSEIIDQKQQLQEQSEKLKEMDKVKSRFFANISHEFRTPLTLIIGPLEHMISSCADKEQEKKLGMMFRNSRRLLGLINQLLELSTFDSGKVKLQAAPQNIVAFIKGISASFEMAANQKEQDLTVYREEENITVYFDAEKLEEVTGNLLANALKFTPPGGKVTVSVKTITGKNAPFSPGAVEISISDTGPGIPPGQLADIFDRFYQAESTYEHHHKGSGIGLAIAKEIVELHHGTIDVTGSEEETGGTTFVIHLPLGNAHLEPDEIVDLPAVSRKGKKTGEIPGSRHRVDFDIEEEIEEEKQTGKGEKIVIDEAAEEEKDIILVVEDSAAMREYIKSSLETVYTVAEAKDGREGIREARAIVPDLIISDIMMPEVDGYELCKVLKRDVTTSHIPVVLLTAKAAEEDVIRGLETGADDYITKPFNTKILLTRIKNLIELRRQLQQKIQREMVLQPTEMAVSPVDREFIKELRTALEQNMSEPGFGVDELAKTLYMSRATLNRKIRALTGESTNRFIQSYRLKRGAQLLKTNFGNVTDVAFEVGFSSSAYFTKCFKEKFHQLPHTFQATEFSKQ